MRWVLCGKNRAAVRALEFLAERGEEVWAVGAVSDAGVDGWQPSFRAAAARLAVPFDQPSRINESGFVERLAAFGATALISLQYDQILRDRLFRAVGCPCLNFHFALLPRHRGVAPIAWAILCGDREAGVTLHHMVEDIDAGDVIAQRALAIGPGDTARELYDRVADAAVALFEQCYPFPPALLETRLVQDPRVASYHRGDDLDFSKRRVDWNRPGRELHAWLRAMIFPPLQCPEARLGGRRLAIERVGELLGDAVSAPPGTVVARFGAEIDVATADRSIRIRALRDAEPRAAAGDALASIAVGDRLD